MREYLFRGKDTETGKWVIGFYFCYYQCDPNTHFIRQKDSAFTKEVIPETVGQFTGFSDVEGVKIFEGDIVKICCGHEDETTINEVLFMDGEWIADTVGGEYDSLYNQIENCEHEVEVIGNIYDNESLLESEYD